MRERAGNERLAKIPLFEKLSAKQLDVVDGRDSKRLLEEYSDLRAPLLEVMAQRLAVLDDGT